jgi:phage terminase large subunit-like protein
VKGYYQYLDDVESGRVTVCDAMRKSTARFKADLEASKKKNSPYYFDESKADKIIEFIEHLVQFEEPFAGRPLHLEPWQCFFLGQLYGWRNRKTKMRRFKKALLFMGRKQGKTILASALALYEIFSKPGIEAYGLATKQTIADKSFRYLERFIGANPDLKTKTRIVRSPHKLIEVPKSGSQFMPLSSDTKLDGPNPAYCIIDELSTHDSPEAYNTLVSGMGTRSEPLTIIISTASSKQVNPLIEEYAYARKVLDGSMVDDSFLVSIYEYDPTDRWDDLGAMQKSSPNLGVSTNLAHYADELKLAKAIPSKALEYKTKYCNLWQSSSNVWIPDKLWTRCQSSRQKAATPEEISAAPCVIALDFSTIWDWTAATRYYHIERLDKFLAMHRFYIPESQIDTKMHLENQSIRAWIESGQLVATPGEAIDYDYVFRDIDADLEAYNVSTICYDPAKAKEFEMRYANRVPVLPFQQRSANISPAAKAWEKAIVDGQIIDDSPILRWMVSNTTNKIHPDSGSYFITKIDNAKSRKRIDGVITSLMAFAVLRQQMQDIANRPKIFDLSKIQY